MIGASRTAERVAERRALHQLLDVPPVLADPIALRVLRPEVAAALTKSPRAHDSRISRYLRAFFAVRSRFAEDEVARAVTRGVTQYVVVGAGFDTFAYRNPFPELRVFEVDHPATQQVKRERLDAAGITPSASFVASDLSVQSLGDALASSDFDNSQPAIFSWLGVVVYLTREAIEATLRSIASLPKESTIVFDYGIPRESLGMIGRLVFDRMAEKVAAIGEPWQSFFTPDAMNTLLQSSGFRSVEDLGAAEINARYFADRTDGLRVGEAARLVRASV